jgi:hypothetical protein
MGLMELQYEEGQTPLDEDEKDGLVLPSVTTKGELDEVEQRNIEEAIRWTTERRRRFTVVIFKLYKVFSGREIGITKHFSN